MNRRSLKNDTRNPAMPSNHFLEIYSLLPTDDRYHSLPHRPARIVLNTLEAARDSEARCTPGARGEREVPTYVPRLCLMPVYIHRSSIDLYLTPDQGCGIHDHHVTQPEAIGMGCAENGLVSHKQTSLIESQSAWRLTTTDRCSRKATVHSARRPSPHPDKRAEP